MGIEPYKKYANKHVYVTRVLRIRRIARMFKPDVVFAPYLISNGLTAVLSWRGPLVVSARGSDVFESLQQGGWRRAMNTLIISYICRRAQVVHAVSIKLAETLRRLGVAERKLYVFPTGVDCMRFKPADRHGRPAVPRIICTRKHEPVYDIPTIIQALIELKKTGLKFTCTFVGGGHLRSQHERMAQTGGLADSVTFMDAVPHQDIPQLLQSADIYVSASLRDGTSSSLLEAMVMGLVPVVSRIEANLDWITEGSNGLMFAPGSVSELCESLTKAIQGSINRQHLVSINVRLVHEKANMETNMQRLENLLKSAIQDFS